MEKVLSHDSLNFRRWYIAVFLLSFFYYFFLNVAGAQSFPSATPFELLSETQEGIQYLKDPCYGNVFSLIFSFSEDIQDPPQRELALVAFSSAFEEMIRSLYQMDKTDDVALYYGAPQKLGNRQVQIDYVVKKVSMEGPDDFDSDIELPDQIEIVIENNELAKILDIHHRYCAPIDDFKKKITLINKNAQIGCLK